MRNPGSVQPLQGGGAALRVSMERGRGALLWLTALSGAFVFVEPGPYEVLDAPLSRGMTRGPNRIRSGRIPIVYELREFASL